MHNPKIHSDKTNMAWCRVSKALEFRSPLFARLMACGVVMLCLVCLCFVFSKHAHSAAIVYVLAVEGGPSNNQLDANRRATYSFKVRIDPASGKTETNSAGTICESDGWEWVDPNTGALTSRPRVPALPNMQPVTVQGTIRSKGTDVWSDSRGATFFVEMGVECLHKESNTVTKYLSLGPQTLTGSRKGSLPGPTATLPPYRPTLSVSPAAGATSATAITLSVRDGGNWIPAAKTCRFEAVPTSGGTAWSSVPEPNCASVSHALSAGTYKLRVHINYADQSGAGASVESEVTNYLVTALTLNTTVSRELKSDPGTVIKALGADQVAVVEFSMSPADPIEGDQVRLGLTIKNTGTSVLSSVPWEMTTGAQGESWRHGASPTSVSPGQEFTAWRDWVATAGHHRFDGWADPKNTFQESSDNRRNNIAKTIDVNVPKIVTQLLDRKEAEKWGGKFDYGNQAKNCGVADDDDHQSVTFLCMSGPLPEKGKPYAFKDFKLHNRWTIKQIQERVISNWGGLKWLVRARAGTDDPFMQLELWSDSDFKTPADLDPPNSQRGMTEMRVKIWITGPEGRSPYRIMFPAETR